MFRLNRNERSHWSGNGVHVEPESVFMIGRNMQLGDYAGATLNDSLLTIRFLADDNLIVQRVIRDIWQFLRPLLTHKAPVLPRIWQT